MATAAFSRQRSAVRRKWATTDGTSSRQSTRPRATRCRSEGILRTLDLVGVALAAGRGDLQSLGGLFDRLAGRVQDLRDVPVDAGRRTGDEALHLLAVLGEAELETGQAARCLLGLHRNLVQLFLEPLYVGHLDPLPQ